MSENYFPFVKGRGINYIHKYLPIFRDTLITACCLGRYICTVVREASNRVWLESVTMLQTSDLVTQFRKHYVCNILMVMHPVTFFNIL